MAMPSTEDTTHLSHQHAARLAGAAGQLYTALQKGGDDLPAWVQIALRDALDAVDDVRGRDTAVAMARTHIAGEVPRQ
ncbi:hypothetical protein ACFQZ2_05370 [Streptomonospora algeriensis]|uniref:ANTAR domain-containing protein n=1 Tax=Streptomonospora algeriensis TaxID=995084 RepID=A0ABW3BCV5_9ACTN